MQFTQETPRSACKRGRSSQEIPVVFSFAPVPCVSLDPCCNAPQFLLPEQLLIALINPPLRDLEVWPPILESHVLFIGRKKRSRKGFTLLRSIHSDQSLQLSSHDLLVCRRSAMPQVVLYI